MDSNGVDSDRGSSLTEAAQIVHPAYGVGLTLKFPLFNHERKAAVKEAKANRIRATAIELQTRDTLRLNWINGCSKFHQLQDSYLKLYKAFTNQKQRVKLEEKRFGLGRIPTINVIQAGDDATTAEITMQQAEVERRIAAWEVARLSGDLEKYIKRLDKKTTK